MLRSVNFVSDIVFSLFINMYFLHGSKGLEELSRYRCLLSVCHFGILTLAILFELRIIKTFN